MADRHDRNLKHAVSDEELQFDYSVVTFADQEDVEAVPTKWLCFNNSQCKWPPKSIKNISTLIKAKTSPNNDWLLYPVTLIKQYGSYADALRKVRKITDKGEGMSYTSEESEGLIGKGCRKKFPTQKIRGNDHEEEIEYVQPTNELQKNIYEKTGNEVLEEIPECAEIIQPQETSLRNLLPIDLTFLETDYVELNKKIDALMKSQDVILREMCKLSIEMQEVKKAVTNIKMHPVLPSEDEFITNDTANYFNFPLCSIPEFVEFNENLKNEDIKKAFMSKMKVLRNPKVGVFVRAMLEHIISPNLSKKLAWTSAKNNTAIGNSPLVMLMKEIIDKFGDPNCSAQLFKDSISNWLKNATYRVNKEKKTQQSEMT